MTRFNVGGTMLDIPANLSLTFSKKNILLSIDGIECDRTASFTLPTTPTNDAALGVARDYHFTGQSMRVKIEAQMVDGTIVRDGFLYVTEYNGKGYECTFIYGENVGLKTIKESGAVSTYLRNQAYIPDSVTWSVSFDTTPKNIGMAVYYNYWTGDKNTLRSWRAPHPYANFGYIMRKAAQRLGVTLVDVPAAVDSLVYVINGELKDGNREAIEFGDNVPLYVNLPDWTLLDMLKIAASLTGTLLNIKGSEVRFFSASVSSLTKKDISGSIIEISKVERKVGDYAQTNTVIFDNGDEMLASYAGTDPIVQEFDIDNVNLTEEKTLYTLTNLVKPETLPMADYGACISSVKNRTYNGSGYDVDYWEEPLLIATVSAIPSGCTQAGKMGLKAFPITLGGGFDFITQVCNKSTQLEVKAKMSHLEYEELQPETLLHINGADFVWREMQYCNGVATLYLCKV